MLNLILNLYRWMFARVAFYKLNKLLYLCSLRGLGILNYESTQISGESTFLNGQLKKLPPNACVIDVGANVGNYSKFILDIVPNATLIAFEPHPKTFKKLTASVKHTKFIPVNAAVGSENGVLSLYDYDAADGSEHATLFKDVIENIHQAKSIEHKVEVIRLGDYLTKKNIFFIDLLKIDTEGNELAVLKGISEYLENNKVKIIHFEFNEMNISSRTFFRDFWNLLPNYDFFRLLPDGMLPVRSYSPLFCELFAYQNIVAINKFARNT